MEGTHETLFIPLAVLVTIMIMVVGVTLPAQATPYRVIDTWGTCSIVDIPHVHFCHCHNRIALVGGVVQAFSRVTGQEWNWDLRPGLLIVYVFIGFLIALAQLPILWRQLRGSVL